MRVERGLCEQQAAFAANRVGWMWIRNLRVISLLHEKCVDWEPLEEAGMK